MCAIGRALMSGPKLLLLDEPSAGLAPVVVQSIFELVKRICAEGYTVLIVEQNIRQVLKVVGPRLPARDRPHQGQRRGGASCSQSDADPQGLPGNLTMEIFDIFLLEAVLNGLLLGGLLALLSLGLNLIFGVIDVVWICYAELIMIGMYAVYYLHVQYHWPLVLAMLCAIALVARARRGAAPVRDPAGAGRRADQPAAGHRRRAVLPAGGGDAGLRRRVQEPRRAACRAIAVGEMSFSASRAHRLRGGARRHGGDVPVPHAHATSAPRSAPSARTARSCR